MKTYPTSIPHRTGLWLACLTSFALFVPAASAAVSLTPTVNEPECVVMSGSWVGGFFSDVAFLDEYALDLLDVYVELISTGVGGALWLSDYTGYGLVSFALTFPRLDDALGDIQRSEIFGSGRSGTISATFDVNTGWSGTYKITDANCEPSPVPDAAGTLALFACGLGAVGAGRRFMNKRRA